VPHQIATRGKLNAIKDGLRSAHLLLRTFETLNTIEPYFAATIET